MTLRLLDLFCCSGGAAEGYSWAGFEVTGIDIAPQPRYRHKFIQFDVLQLGADWIVDCFDAIHASPPCQAHTILRHAPGTKQHANLIPATRDLLQRTGLPFIIENVVGAREHLTNPITLCGTMFGLGAAGCDLHRHRLFESNIPIKPPGPCLHTDRPVIGVYGGHVRNRSVKKGGRGTVDFAGHDRRELAREAMQMPWATMAEMSEAIPPAYTAHLGRQLIQYLNSNQGVAA